METEYPKIRFHESFTEADREIMTNRGLVLSVTVEVSCVHRYDITVMDINRVVQEFDGNVSRGWPFFAEPGLIIVPEVTVDAINVAVNALYKRGFFESLKPL